MLKNVLATVGLLAVVVGVAIWQFGFLSEASKKIDRATATARAEKALSSARSNAAKLDQRARDCRVKAETLELEWKRTQENIATKKEALRRLALAAKNAGLPAPSARNELSDEQRLLTLTFGAKTIGAADVYSTLERWNDEIRRAQAPADATKKTVDRLRDAATEIRSRQADIERVAEQIAGRLNELRVAKDLAKIDVELAEMEASADGLAVGNLGKALDALQNEIDESTAKATVYRAESSESNGGLNPEDVVAPPDAASELDALWNADETPTNSTEKAADRPDEL